jgi:hypothetical protein
MRCDNVYKGWKRKCHTRLEEYFGNYGSISYRCPRCALVDRGRCWKCGDLRSKPLSAFCDSCIKEKERNNRRNYARTKKGREAILRYRRSEKCLENKRESARKRYIRKKKKLIRDIAFKLGYSSIPRQEPPIQKSGYSCEIE